MEATKETTPKEVTKDAKEAKDENPYVELVNKKIRKTNKKMQRIVELEAQLKESKAKINEDQRKLLESKEGTSAMLKEFQDLRTQIVKLALGDKAESANHQGSAKQKKPKKKKETKESTPTSAPNQGATTTQAPAQPTPASSQPSAPATQPQTQETKTEEKVAQPAPEAKKEEVKPAETQPVVSSTSQDASQGQEAEGAEEAEGEEDEAKKGGFEDKKALRKEWDAQKQIYFAKFQASLGPEHENKYIAVCKGVLYGPCDTLQELKERQGGEKLPGAFLARVGHENEPPVIRRQGGRGGFRGGRGGRGSGRGGERGRGGRGGRGNGAPRGGEQS